MQPQTLKGFRDFLSYDVKKREFIKNILKKSFEKYGFEPLETPALEYEELLSGKYGEEGDKLMYKFEDNGGRKVALRYDQTVPLARVASNNRDIPLPYKRYQMQLVWRADNPQRGRYREFLQCDADTLGTDSVLTDAELISLAADGLASLGFTDIKIRVNDRTIFNSLGLVDHNLTSFLTILDKLDKIGIDKVKNELSLKNIDSNLLEKVQSIKPTDYIIKLKKTVKSLGTTQDITFDPTLARGLNYYTSLIFEIELKGYSSGSVCGGGRYNNLIKDLAGFDLPASGFAYGFDRIQEAMEENNLFPETIQNSTTKVLVTLFNDDLISESINLTRILRTKSINAQIYDNPDADLSKQLKYANNKNIPFAAIIGPNEYTQKKVTIKNMHSGEEKTVSIEDLPDELD